MQKPKRNTLQKCTSEMHFRNALQKCSVLGLCGVYSLQITKFNAFKISSVHYLTFLEINLLKYPLDTWVQSQAEAMSLHKEEIFLRTVTVSDISQ